MTKRIDKSSLGGQAAVMIGSFFDPISEREIRLFEVNQFLDLARIAHGGNIQKALIAERGESYRGEEVEEIIKFAKSNCISLKGINVVDEKEHLSQLFNVCRDEFEGNLRLTVQSYPLPKGKKCWTQQLINAEIHRLRRRGTELGISTEGIKF